MIHRGVASFGLDGGHCPPWLFERMVKLGREMVQVLIAEYGPDEFIKRIADPVWFQSLGTVLAFDWNASGLTTILTAALKEAIRSQEQDLGIFICGGKGKTSRKTPDEIRTWGERLSLPTAPTENLVYNSKMSAKVDSALVQDGFQLYHHAFFFSVRRNAQTGRKELGSWAVVQQGMNTQKASARRYHWFSEDVHDLVEEPHSAITSPVTVKTVLDLTAKASGKTREISTELAQSGYTTLMKDIQLLRKHSTRLNQMVKLQNGEGRQLTLLNLESKEFTYHPMIHEDFSRSKYLEKVLATVSEYKPKTYEELVALKGVGPKTVRALALVGEVIYGAEPSYEDPARYSFAHGGKDGTPYLVDRKTYDETITILGDAVRKTKLASQEKQKALGRLWASQAK
ncbi:MAG TPA: DUF763 domain-containing protein [Candidatus Paceibacterota bacterium]|nr:DUF763 domain-containing protein [Candidatus Paceibacterota bacterium]